MSSVTRSSQQQSSETTTKKKFGKNLNKLTQAPAPPIASGTKPNNSSRNGLLLLSTKRPSSGTNAAASSGGILYSKPSQTVSKPLPTLDLQYQSELSTHDALLGAVVGASRAEAQQQPDAWGVADKHQYKGLAGDQAISTLVEGFEESRAPSNLPVSPNVELGHDAHDAESEISQGVRSSNLDEYGGRNIQANGSNDGGDPQEAYMSRIAKERQGRRRAEEEERRNEQKERAAQKLRELEQKMEGESASQPEMESDKPEIMLEKLGRSMSTPEEHNPRHPETQSAERNTQRTLYDPNNTIKSYSSLLAGDASRSGQEPPRVDAPRSGRKAPGAYAPDPHSDSRDAFSRQPVIQLSSYDARDRGERGSSAGPRMLYDPKSGSMVAVPSREEAASNRGRKERGKKGRNSREKEGKGDPRLDSDGTKSGRKGKGRRDENGTHRGKETASPAKADSKKGKVNNERKLPRTCGVLYSKDNKCNFYCSDGCDGDLGYGAHSVPGGRARNPEAYEKFVEGQEQMHHDDMHMYDNHHMEVPYEDDSEALVVTLQTGFSVPEPKEVKLDWLKPNEKIELITGIDDSPTLQATAKEWAPSRAAIAAASTVTRETPPVSTSVESLDGHEEDDDDDAPFGLGFDPTLNMDSVMQSPSAEPTNGLDSVDLTVLSLEPALNGTTKSNHNIFAFESGATWGSSGTGGNNDWGIPSSGNGFSNDDTGKNAMPASFLSLSSNTWGGVPGLGGTTLGGSSLNGDHLETKR